MASHRLEIEAGRWISLIEHQLKNGNAIFSLEDEFHFVVGRMPNKTGLPSTYIKAEYSFVLLEVTCTPRVD